MEILLQFHNLLRWILIPVMAFVLYRSYAGWLGNASYQKLDNATGGAMIGLAHLQLLLGLIVYFAVSPYFDLLKADTGAVMKDPVARMKAIEHPLMMIIGIVFLQLGRSFSKKAATDQARFKKIAIYTTIALALILSRQINWNFL
jgi:Na+/H+-dicarboxylate symporter